MEDKFKIVSVSGFCATGSSAIFDLLLEFSNTESFPYEFRLLKDPDGIIDLYNSLFDRWDDLNVDIALRRFDKYVEVLGRKNRCYLPLSYNYDELLGHKFYQAISRFKKNLNIKSWQGTWPYHWHEYSSFKWFVYRCLARLKKEQYLYSSDSIQLTTRDNFYFATKELFNDLCEIIAKGDTSKLILFDQLIPAINSSQYMKFFYDSRIIIVDRDPRNVYVRGLIWPFIPTDNVSDFIYWYKTIRMEFRLKYTKNNSILCVHFEDLIYKYESTLSVIKDFLSLDDSMHVNKLKIFKPQESMKNTQTWYNIDSSIISRIEKELEEYCYNFDGLNDR